MKHILYIVNFYGTPPLNYFEKYIRENNKAHISILKLPAVRSSKGRLAIDAFLKDHTGKMYEVKQNIFFPFPYFLVFLFQYVLNIFIAFILLHRGRQRTFDVIIGETNFGSALAFVLKKIGWGSESVYFNGDILPNASSSKKCFFLPNTKSHLKGLYKFIDTLILNGQFILRKIGYHNDLIWYGNNKIKKWDESQHLHARKSIIHDAIRIDLEQFDHWKKVKKDRYKLGYIGRIDDYVGLDMIIPALALLKKDFPLLKLHIIGGNQTAWHKYDLLCKRLHIEDAIVFHGYVPKMEDALKILSTCTLGMALYKPVKDNVSMYAQPAKPKDYIQVNVPVLVTRGGPQIGDEIVASDAGVYADFNSKSVCSAISEVLKDSKRIYTLQKGVEAFAIKSDYQKNFAAVWSDIEEMV